MKDLSKELILRSPVSAAKLLHKTVGEYVWHKLCLMSDHSVCLIEAVSDVQITVAELKCLSTSISVALLSHGLTKSDKIAFYGHNSIQHSVLRFATYWLGTTFLPLSPTFGSFELEEEVVSMGATVIITSAQELHKFDAILSNESNGVKLVIVFDGKHDKYVTYEQLVEEGRGQTLTKIPYFDINPEVDMFFMIHTSGSTGRPKCAKIKHSSVLHLISERDTFISVDSWCVVSLSLAYGHISGAQMLPNWVTSGAKVIIYSQYTDECMLKSIEKYRITHFMCMPMFGHKLVSGYLCDRYDLSSLRVIMTGGAKFPTNIARDIINKYNVRFSEGYGMTEYLFITSGTPYENQKQHHYLSGNLGPVSPGAEVKIVDLATDDSLGPNQDGEICVRGCKLFDGYHNNEKATLEAFDREGWYRTGDIGHYDDKEYLYITDRIKDVMRVYSGGHYMNISPVEIEQFLLTHPSIAEAAVVGVSNRTGAGNQWPRAYVVLREGVTASEDAINDYVLGTLSFTKQLRGGIVFVDRIERTVIGKVDRKHYKNLVVNEIID